MSGFVLGLNEEAAAERRLVGGKGAALAALSRLGFLVPPTLLVTTEAYRSFVKAGRLDGVINMEINRKDFADMRWEELWDAALRLRNRFLNTPFTPEFRQDLGSEIEKHFSGVPLAVRSSSVAEDSGNTSFAGLHESYVNVSAEPVDRVLDHIKLVWASLWSDRALLYRQELGLDVSSSEMAVVIQQLVEGESSGIMFTRAPDMPRSMMIEAVYGLNQGLVDGSVQPDRWTIDRRTLEVREHLAPEEHLQLAATAPDTLTVGPVPSEASSQPPLTTEQVKTIAGMGISLERSFEAPQDVEWTFDGRNTVLLQSRPITAGAQEKDERSWYLSLHRSLANLQSLRRRVEDHIIPNMEEDAARLGQIELQTLTREELEHEILSIKEILARWEGVYREECIPLAHGVRLFGAVYNDTVRPEDPFEFLELLTGTEMESLARNRALEQLAVMHEKQGIGADAVTEEDISHTVEGFLAEHGAAMFGGLSRETREEALIKLAGRYSMRQKGRDSEVERETEKLKTAFLNSYVNGPEAAGELLDLARASYRLRDDDNIHLGRIRSLLLDAMAERSRRGDVQSLPEVVMHGNSNSSARDLFASAEEADPGSPKARQIVGQPASRGIGQGPARVISSPADLQAFQAGEVLVCDAIDPTMTYVCPLASGIVERRGGMLIHGAIIAREYGIPCVTGVPGATKRIRTGERVIVDGFLGIVTVQRDLIREV